jgi:hypothetical protein
LNRVRPGRSDNSTAGHVVTSEQGKSACGLRDVGVTNLVEDDPEVLLGTKQALGLAGFEVEPFTDAETAAKQIVADVTAIVVCDVKLPGSTTVATSLRYWRRTMRFPQSMQRESMPNLAV